MIEGLFGTFFFSFHAICDSGNTPVPPSFTATNWPLENPV